MRPEIKGLLLRPILFLVAFSDKVCSYSLWTGLFVCTICTLRWEGTMRFNFFTLFHLLGRWFLLCWRCWFLTKSKWHSQARRSLLCLGGKRDQRLVIRGTGYNQIWREGSCVLHVLKTLWCGEWGKCQTSPGLTTLFSVICTNDS